MYADLLRLIAAVDWDNPASVKEALTRVVEELESVVSTNLQRATRLRQSILKWAFEGKLVDQDPNDEPASVLLQRIREERGALKNANQQGRRTRSFGVQGNQRRASRGRG